MRRRPLLGLVVLALAGLACGGPAVPAATPAPTQDSSTLTPDAPPGEAVPFTIAIEYAIPGVAEAYASTGVSYAKPQPIFGMWGILEPRPGEYNWKPLDDLVVEYQSAGFSGIQLLITAESPWASIDPPAGLNLGSTFPKEEYLDEYAGFVGRFVERYDGDGVDDAPGLLYPVHHYGIEREFTGFWPGSAEEYVRLLRAAYPAAHAADPEAEVLLVAILIADVFDGAPGPAEVQHRLETPQAGMRKSVPEIETILAACDAYDVVDFHSLGDYTEIPPTAAWLREQLAAHGCGEKPLWIGDAFSMSALLAYNARPFTPATRENRDRVIAVLQSVADPASSGHAAARDWLRAELARGLVRKVVVSAAEALRGINIGNLEDWKTGVPAADRLAVHGFGTSMFMGMTDVIVTGKSTGERLPGYRRAGEARPAFYALGAVTERLAGFTSVEKLDLGVDGVWAYRFERPAGPLWVVWYDDGALRFPGEPSPSVSVELGVDATRVIVTHTPILAGETSPPIQAVDTAGGVFRRAVDSTPLFVEVQE